MNRFIISKELEEYVDKHMTSFNCGAHDVLHAYRVANLAVQIAEVEKLKNGIDIDLRLVFISGLVHDVLDTKLINENDSSSIEDTLIKILSSYGTDEQKLTLSEANKVISIIKSVGYKNLLSPTYNVYEKSIEYRCVQDADLLDAIGAVGVGRCFAFGGRMKRSMFGGIDVDDKENLTQEKYKEQQKQNVGSGVAHFFDKLLKLKDMMSTVKGKELAVKRHQFMIDFLNQVDDELVDSSYDEAGNIRKRIKLLS